VPVRVLRDQRRSFETDLSQRIAAAVRWAVDTGHAGVINLSLTTLPTPQLRAAIRYALDRRVVVVAAAGNEGESGQPGQPGQPSYPAAYDGVLGVAGVDLQDGHVSSSSTGAYVDVAAPGVRIAGPAPAGRGFLFSEEGGTSFAAAYVSGVAALVRAYHPELTPDEVADRITQTAEHPADRWNPEVGFGVVDPARAVGALRVESPPRQPEPDGRMQLQPVPPDPQHGLTVTAVWVAVIGGAVVLLLRAVVPVMRRGRQRGWRPGRL
jgi:subtilisin family serine protease